MEIVCSWKTLFALAAAAGRAKMAALENTCDDTEAAHRLAVAEHDRYRDLCLEADRMIHFPALP